MYSVLFTRNTAPWLILYARRAFRPAREGPRSTACLLPATSLEGEPMEIIHEFDAKVVSRGVPPRSGVERRMSRVLRTTNLMSSSTLDSIAPRISAGSAVLTYGTDYALLRDLFCSVCGGDHA